MFTDTDTEYTPGNDNQLTNQMDVLTHSINDASRSMKSIERLHREMSSQHTNDMEMLREELSRYRQEDRVRAIQNELSEDIPSELRRSPARLRASSSPHRQQMNEDTIYLLPTSGGKLRRSGSVRFVGEGGGGFGEYHEIHQSIRDLTNEQTRLREEILKQNRGSTTGGPLRDHVEHVRRAQSSDASAAAADVEKRLLAVQEELKAERRQLDRRHADVGMLSPALNAALDKYRRDASAATEKQVPTLTPSVNTSSVPAQPVESGNTATSENLLRSRLKQSEASRLGMESEVDALKRKLDHMEGSNQAMHKQLSDSQSHMFSLERENKQLRIKLEEVEATSHRLRLRHEEEEISRRDKATLEKEMFELKTQLSQTVSVSDLEDMRRNKDKAERQRDQLQDQVLNVTRDLEKKERSLSKLLDDLRETQVRADTNERGRTEANAREETSERELRESRRREEGMQENIVRLERQLLEAEQAREQLRSRSTESIKQLKAKTTRYQKEIERLREATNESSSRADEYSQETERLRRQMQCLQAQCDAGRREIEELLNARTRLESQLNSREDEIESLRLLKYELEARVESCEKHSEKLNHDAEALRHELASGMEERARLEEKLAAADAAQAVAHDQLRQAARDYKELVREKTELAAQHSEVITQNQDLKHQLADMEASAYRVTEEKRTSENRFNEERREHQSQVKNLTKQIEDLRHGEKRKVSDLQKKLRHLERASTSQLQSARTRIDEEQEANRLLMNQNSKQSHEIARLHDEYLRMDEELSKIRRKYEKAREELDSKISSTDMDAVRYRQLEEDVIDAHERVGRMERELTDIMRAVITEVDGLVDVAAEDLSDLRATLIPPGHDLAAIGDSMHWLAEIQAKIGWLKMEFRQRRSRENQLKEEFTHARDNLHCADQLVEELKEENQREHKAVTNLIDEIRQLEDNLEVNKTQTLRHKLDALDTVSATKMKFDAERDTLNIQEKYAKIQNQLNLLQPDISASNSPMPLTTNHQISPNVTEKLHSNVSDGNSRKFAPSPTPMNMTDEEFREKFIPRASPLSF